MKEEEPELEELTSLETIVLLMTGLCYIRVNVEDEICCALQSSRVLRVQAHLGRSNQH
jgi:hypothetical protein